MCRIVGIKKLSSKIDPHILDRMRDSLSHGGPDAANVYINEDRSIGLGHRRLSILDLSEAGNQPMYYKQWVLIFNGEIYNFQEIKDELTTLGVQFTTGTDTEMLLKAFEVWGYDCVDRFRGMFAFALWDKTEKKLILCRDRVGVKPLYYYKKDGLFMFASELKAFHEHPDFDKTINQNAVNMYLQQGYISAPHCIFKYVHKLEGGSFLEVSDKLEVKTIPYWNIEDVYRNSTIDTRNEEDICEELESILVESFQLRMVSDVPVGMFLSGGIDSSLVTALIQKNFSQPVKTFTIGFHDKEKNEANYAKEISNHLGTDHTELYCTQKEAINIIPHLAEFYDEPFGDSSSIPTYLVSKLAKESVSVSLSADGGDELFGGYTKYEIAKKYVSTLEKIPFSLRKIGSKTIRALNQEWIEKYGHHIPLLKNYKDLNNKLSKFENALMSKDVTSFFNASSVFISPHELEKYHSSFIDRFTNTQNKIKENQLISYLGMIDIKTYLEGDIMTKVDRATMQVALEGREPFLDQNIIEFSQNIPDKLKVKAGSTKHLLREILYKHVPKELIERPKMGFSIPVEKWLKELLFDQLEYIKEDNDFYLAFELDSKNVKALIDKFLKNKGFVNPHIVWFFYILHQWYLRWLK